MTQRNIHGEWEIKFQERILITTVSGATNEEAAHVWFNEVKQCILESKHKKTTPWCFISDLRNWEMSPSEVWEPTNAVFSWAFDNQCIFWGFIFSKQIQKFALERGALSSDKFQFFFGYDEAYQACLDKLAEAKNQKGK
ncbi:hypothetical protein L4C34_03800 [Vibrio profundum]|uniref:hypothetical protein n=1 Tax=Vibrio profundum TaxID=2910247 RepID=UPI003D0A127D